MAQETTSTTPPTRKQHNRGKAASRRALDATRKLLSEGGFEATQMSQISNESGVSIGSLYHHFGSKEVILTKLVEEFGGQVRTDLAALVLEGSTFDDKLQSLLALTCKQFSNNVALYRSMAERMKAMPEIWQPLRSIRQAFEQRMCAELSDGLIQRGINNPSAAINQMMQVILGVLTHSVVFDSAPVRITAPDVIEKIYHIGQVTLLHPYLDGVNNA